MHSIKEKNNFNTGEPYAFRRTITDTTRQFFLTILPLRTKKPSPKEGVFWERVISFYGGTEMVIVSWVVAGCFFLKQDMSAMPAMTAPQIRARAVKKLPVTAMDLPPRQTAVTGGKDVYFV